MNSTLCTLLKGSTLAFYVTVLISPPGASAGPQLQHAAAGLGILAIAHPAECILGRKRLEAVPGHGSGHFVNVMLFSFMCRAPLLKSAPQR